MRINVFDYGAGNLHSLVAALRGADRDVRIVPDAALAVVDADVLVLPGVGAFGAAATRLAAGREAMCSAIVAGLPTLGICLGMQLLFEGSDEGPGGGLGVIPGRVTRIDADRLPHIGWNTLDARDDALFTTSGLEVAYFANGFACRPDDASSAIAWSEHERDRFPAAVRQGNCVGVQFHPEKSSVAGRRFIDAFLDDAFAARTGSVG